MKPNLLYLLALIPLLVLAPSNILGFGPSATNTTDVKPPQQLIIEVKPHLATTTWTGTIDRGCRLNSRHLRLPGFVDCLDKRIPCGISIFEYASLALYDRLWVSLLQRIYLCNLILYVGRYFLYC
jgi:hypothetical protein